MMAFAYVSKYTRRSGQVIREEVGKRVTQTTRDAFSKTDEAMMRGFAPYILGPAKKDVTTEEDQRSVNQDG